MSLSVILPDELVKSSDLADLLGKIPKYLLKHIEA